MAKPYLARLICPLNGCNLDLASAQAIEVALAEFPGAMLVVSHDEDFLRAL